MLGFRRLFLAAAGAVVFGGSLPAQTPTPSSAQTSQPTAPAIEPQEPIRTLTEEVQLTVTALDGQGRLDQTVEVADILVLEDGVAQEIRSARQVPASVVLLLDTGGDVNTAKRLAVTREVARRLLTTLTTGDQISVIQFNSRIELLQDWTSDITALKAVLDTRLLSGKRARLLDGMRAAIEQFRRAPTANRHLVMITQYIVTYKPRRSLAAARPGEVRKIDVASRRVGLQLVSRRHYTVAGNPDTTGQSRPRRVLN